MKVLDWNTGMKLVVKIKMDHERERRMNEATVHTVQVVCKCPSCKPIQSWLTCPLFLRRWQTPNGRVKAEEELAVGVFVLWGMLAASRWQPVRLRGLSDGEGQRSWQDANGCDANELQANKQALPSPLIAACLFNTLTGEVSGIQLCCQKNG